MYPPAQKPPKCISVTASGACHAWGGNKETEYQAVRKNEALDDLTHLPRRDLHAAQVRRGMRERERERERERV